MNTQNINYSRYFEYSDNDEVIIKLLDNSNMIIIIEENGS